MAQSNLKFRVHVAWWVPIYVRSVAVFAVLFHVEPNIEKVSANIKRGVRVEFL